MSFTLRSSENGPPQVRDALDNARATMRRSILRRQLIGAEELFGEPAWEMLIDIFRSEEHKSELQALLRISSAVFRLKKKHTRTTLDVWHLEQLTEYVHNYICHDHI